MSTTSKKIKKHLPKELKKECTNEFILLSLFYFTQKYKHELGRMQTVKLLWKFKDLSQDKSRLQAYYSEAYKGKHGRFNKRIYRQITNLKKAGFVESRGMSPLERFKITKKGKKVFEGFDTKNPKDRIALKLVGSNLDKIIREHGKKSAALLRKEDHGKIKEIDKLPSQDEKIILSPNLKSGEIKHQLLFNDQTALDWVTAICIGERKKIEEIVPEESLPRNQEEAYEFLNL